MSSRQKKEKTDKLEAIPAVLFASASVKRLEGDGTLPAKFRRLLEKYLPAEGLKDKRIAIKMHVGGGIGYTTIHPVFVIELVNALKNRGALPFVTDGSYSMAGARTRGYTEEVLGAPLVQAAGINENYFIEKEIGFKSLKAAQLCGNVVHADGMVVFSHGKGHGHSGFGGAIKNIAMGCVTTRTRGEIHKLSSKDFRINHKLCRKCKLCMKNCPANAISYDAGSDTMEIFDHHCRLCLHCVECCPQKAVTVDLAGFRDFQHGMARTVQETLSAMQGKPVWYINVLLGITPLCDCWGFSSPAIVPDIGIMASNDIVAVEQASLDAIKSEKYIPDSLPVHFKLQGGGHLLKQIHGKDPYVQVEEAAGLRLGSRKYELQEVE